MARPPAMVDPIAGLEIAIGCHPWLGASFDVWSRSRGHRFGRHDRPSSSGEGRDVWRTRSTHECL